MVEDNNTYEAALRLKKGEYYSPETAHADEKNSILVKMWNQARTNASSSYPIVGTYALDACTGLAIYNKRIKEVLIDHQPVLFPDDFKSHVDSMRSNDRDYLEIHIIGAVFDKDDPDNSDYLKSELINLTNAIAETPNVILKTFDVGDKPHPGDFAFDARNGRLIRGTSDMSPSTPYDDLERYMDDWEALDGCFDGTTPEYKKSSRIN